MKATWRICCFSALLTFSVTLRLAETQNLESQSVTLSVERHIPDNQENSSIEKQRLQNPAMEFANVDRELGATVVLSCFNTSETALTLLTWKVELRNGSHCLMAFRMDNNDAFHNCSAKITWCSSCLLNSSLKIDSIDLTNEGNYICETATAQGTFIRNTTVAVLVRPEVSLTHDHNGAAVCQASHGKPAPLISWSPENNGHSVEETQHSNWTVTVTSTYKTSNPTRTEVICTIIHPTFQQSWNQSIVISGPSSHTALYAGISCIATIVIIGSCLGLFLFQKKCCRCTNSDVTLRYAQENEVEEVEPYASYVEKANVIYNCVSELNQGNF